MSKPTQHEKITILDREYTIAYPTGELDALFEAARLVDRTMREIQQQSRTLPIDRLAVMTALHLAYQLNQNRQEQPSGSDPTERIQQMCNKIDKMLAEAP
jgi:cell division protein ZapA